MACPLGLQPPRLLVTGRLLGHLERWGRCGERDGGAAPGRPAPAGRSVRSGGRIPRPEAGGGPLWQWACGRSPRTLSVRAEDMGEPPMPRGAAGRTGATPVLLSGGTSTRGADSGTVVHGDVRQQDPDQEGAGGGSPGGEGEAPGQEAQVGWAALAGGVGPGR